MQPAIHSKFKIHGRTSRVIEYPKLAGTHEDYRVQLMKLLYTLILFTITSICTKYGSIYLYSLNHSLSDYTIVL